MTTSSARFLLLIVSLFVIGPAVHAQNLRERELVAPALTTTGTSIPFGICEGRCNSDADCDDDLICFKQQFVPVPGCSGFRPFFSFVNYCIAEPPAELIILGNNGIGPFPLGECQGDCDTDDECGPGLVCFFRDEGSFQAVPGCAGAGSPGTDYCFKSSTGRPTKSPSTTSTPTKEPTTPVPSLSPIVLTQLRNFGTSPFEKCEGNCGNDADCENGLVCFKDQSATPPGCIGLRFAFTNYCIAAPPGQLVIEGNNGIDSLPLGECEGDCDSDDECGPGLSCFQRNGNSVQAIPGCSGTGSPGTDYCFKSSTGRPTKSPSTTHTPTKEPTTPGPTVALVPLRSIGVFIPFGNCEGSCVRDADCENGLVCFRDQQATPPGCTGDRPFFGFTDYCVVATPGQLVIQGNDGIGSFPLGECEGDCDSDDECAPGLFCFQRDGNSVQSVPGCSGFGSPGTDYCFKSSTSRPTVAPSTSSPTVTRKPTSNPSRAPSTAAPTISPRPTIPFEPLVFFGTVKPFGNCEGNCVMDADCENGLVCFNEQSSLFVPGCTGQRLFFVNYCIVAPRGQLVIQGNNGVGSFPLGECEGDCDTDDECAPGLFCFQRDGNSLKSVPGCSGSGSPGTDYCFRAATDRATAAPSTSSPTVTPMPTSSPSTGTPTKEPTTAGPSSAPFVVGSLRIMASGPFGECEGECDDDIECDFGLNCFKPNLGINGFAIPGCTGFNSNGDNFCVEPSAGTLVIEGRDGAPVSAFPLGNCEGVCASDADCEGSLECFSRGSTESVRDCDGIGSAGVSYCFDPVALMDLGDNGFPFNVYPLGLCEGDCDNDNECGEDLVCSKRDRFDPVPGCSGTGVSGTDYCIPGTKTAKPTAAPFAFPAPAPVPAPTPFTFPWFTPVAPPPFTFTPAPPPKTNYFNFWF